MRPVVVFAVAWFVTGAAHAQEPSACARSFSARLADARAEIERELRARGQSAVIVLRDPAAENAACAAEDAQHRVALVLVPGDSLGKLDLMCYGVSSERCTTARSTIDAVRARRARDAAPPTE